MNICGIVIPVYKASLSLAEKKAFIQCLKVLSNRNITIITHKHISLAEYFIIADSIPLEIEYFDEFFFKSVSGYNQLLLSVDFYTRFLQFNYILIYQLDAWVFKDNLDYWCSLKYDYIGAPWINWEWSTFNARHITFPRRLLYKLGYTNFNLVGNGGLSLRKVSSFIYNLKLFQKAASKFDKNEDYFFSFYINSFNPFFKIPTSKLALQFSFDVNPSEAYELNNRQLPMACHAWPKYIEFWDEFIPLNDSN